MRILITGSDGFIGSHLFGHFREGGHEVHGTVFFRAPGENETAVDVRDASQFFLLPDGPYGAIIHTAGIVDQTVPAKKMFAVNAGGTKNLLEWARGRCAHLVQLSSIAVYGLRTMGENRSEESTPRLAGPLGIPYMRSKALAERLIEKSGVPYTLLRLPAVLGRNDSYLSPTILGFLRSGKFCFCGERERMISLICARNLGPIIEGVIGIGPQNDAFNCGDFHVPWREFVAEYAANIGVPLPVKKRSILTLLLRPFDRRYQLIMTFSFFGSHFPTEKIRSRVPITPRCSWQGEVREAIEAASRA